MKTILRKRALVPLFLILLFILSRAIFLDRDTPIMQVTEYVAIDEMYYNTAAFNLYHYGEFTHHLVPYINDDGTPKNIFENVATALSLKTWGNNYYGLRMASVIAALFVFMLFLLFLRNLFLSRRKEPFRLETDKPTSAAVILIFLALAYLMTDFSFLLAGRVAEPTIFRMLAMVFIMFIVSGKTFLRESIPAHLSLLMGFLALTSVLFVYFYNAFIFFAVGMTLLIWAWPLGWKQAVRQIFFFSLGAALSLLAYKFFCQYFYGVTLTDVVKDLIPFKSRMAGSATGLLAHPQHYITNFLAIFSTNIFRLNSAMLFLFLMSLPVFIMHTLKEKSRPVIFTANLMLFLVLQCIIINDFNFRKLVIMLPLVIIIILIAYTHIDEFFTSLQKHKVIKSLFAIYWIFIGYFFVFFMHLGSIKPNMINPDIIINSQAIIPYDISRLNLAVFLFVFIVVTMKYLSNRKVHKIIAILALVALFLPGLYMDFHYVYLNPSYWFRDTMIAMKDRVDDKVVAGGVAYGLRLYNSSIPVLDFYPYVYSTDPDAISNYRKTLTRLFREKKADYSMQFNTGKGFNEQLYMKQRGFELEKRYNFVSLYRPKLE